MKEYLILTNEKLIKMLLDILKCHILPYSYNYQLVKYFILMNTFYRNFVDLKISTVQFDKKFYLKY